MKTNSIYGLALMVGMVAGIVTMAFHPTGVDPRATEETVAHEMSILVAVHTLALMSIPLLIFGFAGVTMRAGWHRPEALLACIIYALSAVALMLAGIADGLINAALIPQMTGAIDSKLQAVKAALSYNFQLNQACAKVFVVGSSLAIGIIGWFISFVALAGPTLRSRYHVRSWFWPHCLAAIVVDGGRGCLDASRGERQRSCYTRWDSTVSCCRFAIPFHRRSRPNQAMQRTADRPYA